MQGDIDSPIYQSLLYARWHRIYWHKSPIYKSLLSAMQGDIEYTGIKLIIYNVNFSNAR